MSEKYRQNSSPIEGVVLVQPGSREDSYRWKTQGTPVASLLPLAAFVPDSLKLELVIDDGRGLSKQLKSTLSLSKALIGITGVTNTASRMADLAKEALDSGAKVVVGGIDVSQRPQSWENTIIGLNAIGRMALVTGEIEKGSFSKVLDNAMNGEELSIKYSTPPSQDLSGIPLPRQEIIDELGKYPYQRVSHARGCYMVPPCEFCGISSTAGIGVRVRPALETIEEMRRRNLIQNDKVQVSWTADSVGSKKDMVFWRTLAREKPHFSSFIQADLVQLKENDELWRILNEIGPTLVGVGLESADRKAISNGIKTGVNNLDPISIIHKIREKFPNIAIQGNFMLGFPHEPVGEQRFENLIDFIIACQLDRAAIGILTPYWSTRTRKKMEERGIRMSSNLDQYDGSHLTFDLRATSSSGGEVIDDPDSFISNMQLAKEALGRILPQWSKLNERGIDFKSSGLLVV